MERSPQLTQRSQLLRQSQPGRTFLTFISTVGTVQSIDSVAIQPRVTGVIEKVGFTPGQDVKQGQELFLIDPRPYQAVLDQAKARTSRWDRP